jgi:tRNA(Arg) A34 adenosine deaminase TadA
MYKKRENLKTKIKFMNLNYVRILDLIINEIIPATDGNVKKGNKIFGAAILNKDDLSTHCIGLNNEIINPLFHGEISTINSFFDKNKTLNSKNYIFVSTHEPCSLCLSAITWAGFTNFYYFFPYKDTKDKFDISHDLNILSQVFNIEKGEYNSNNFYWHSFSILEEIKKLTPDLKKILHPKIDEIYQKYEILSQIYQKSKNETNIPLK